MVKTNIARSVKASKSRLNARQQRQPTMVSNKPVTTTKTVAAPVALSRVDKINRPVYNMPKNNSDGRICIRHKEYIADIPGSVLFSAITYSINPGIPLAFPWLNTISVGYESYRFKRLSYIYESSKSTATNGSVMMAVDFDPTDAAPTTKAQMLAYNNAIRGPSWQTFEYKCSPQDLAKFNQKFLRYGALSTGQDALLYDIGTLFIATSGFADTTTIGELHVDYEVEFFTPQFDLTAYANATAAKLVATGATTTLWLGTAVTATGGVSTSYNGTTGALSVLVPGQYIFVYTITGTTLVTPATPSLTSTGNTFTLLSTANSGSTATHVFAGQIDTSSPITASYITSAASVTGASLRIGYYAYPLA